MTDTSDEGTSRCSQCEGYARRIEKLEAVAQRANSIIYNLVNIYRPGSKKALLKDALDELKTYDTAARTAQAPDAAV